MKNLTKRAYSGIRQRHINEVVWNIYGYKYFQNEDCFKRLCEMAKEDLSGYDFDVIVPIKPRNSGSDIVIRLSAHLADFFNCPLLDCLKPTNKSLAAKENLKNTNVLLIDDVYFTGRTSGNAEMAIKTVKPKSISFYALAKSTTR